MAETIFARVSRLISATVEDSVDRMEQAGGDAVMREAIREADRAIDQVKVDLEAAMTRRLQAARQQKMLTQRVEELTTKAKFALGEGREDLAEAALSRQVDFEAQAQKLDAVQNQAREEEQRLNRLFVAQAGGAEIDAMPRETTIPGYVDAFHISPEGDWAVVTSAPTPLIDDSYTSRRAHVLDLASGETRLVIETPGEVPQ